MMINLLALQKILLFCMLPILNHQPRKSQSHLVSSSKTETYIKVYAMDFHMETRVSQSIKDIIERPEFEGTYSDAFSTHDLQVLAGGIRRSAVIQKSGIDTRGVLLVKFKNDSLTIGVNQSYWAEINGTVFRIKDEQREKLHSFFPAYLIDGKIKVQKKD